MTKSITALTLICVLALSASAQVSEKEILQQCRAALVDLQRAREVEATLRAKITEMEAADKVSQERMKALETAVTKYEAAITARTQAETLVSELRASYEKQLALAEKQLAMEQQKARFNVTMGNVKAIIVGLVLGVIGFVLGSRQ